MGVVTSSTLLPSASICFSTVLDEPVPTAISTITEPTPIISPRIVNPVRSLLAIKPPNATPECLDHLTSSVDSGRSSVTILPVAEPDHAAGVSSYVLLMGDQDDRPPLVAEPVEDAPSPQRRRQCRELPVGSSARTIAGLVTSARAIATRCCWPPDSSDGKVVRPARESPTCAERSQRPLVASGSVQTGVGQRQLDVCQRPRARDQVEALEHEADVRGCARPRARPRRSRERQGHSAGRLPLVACRGIRECSSASSCRSPRRR